MRGLGAEVTQFAALIYAFRAFGVAAFFFVLHQEQS